MAMWALLWLYTLLQLTAASPPNFVFLLADDLGYGDLHYNGGNAETPNLDMMASGEHSIRLNRQYSGGPVCSPTRGTLLTGRNHNRYCIWTANAGNNCNDFACPEGMPLPISEDTLTVAQILQKQGYHTAAFGKWHLGDFKSLQGGNPKWPVSRPDMHGFEEWWMTERSAPTTDLNCACFNASLCPLGHYTDWPPCTNYYSLSNSLGPLEELKERRSGDDSHFLANLFTNFLDLVARTGEPFLIYVPFHTVHVRYIASMGYIQQYMGKNYTQDQIDYYGAITAMDAAVGIIRKALQQYNVQSNTLLWFASDNGPVKGSPGSTAGFRGWKTELYEGGIRVPGIIEWPDVITSNRVSNYSVVTSDFLPTVCDILGIDPPKNLDGTSILPLLHNTKSARNETISWAFEIHNGNFSSHFNAVISGDQYKVFASYSGGQIVSAELYDLIHDPYETKNISALHPDIVQPMKTELEGWLQSVYNSATEIDCLGVSKASDCAC